MGAISAMLRVSLATSLLLVDEMFSQMFTQMRFLAAAASAALLWRFLTSKISVYNCRSARANKTVFLDLFIILTNCKHALFKLHNLFIDSSSSAL